MGIKLSINDFVEINPEYTSTPGAGELDDFAVLNEHRDPDDLKAVGGYVQQSTDISTFLPALKEHFKDLVLEQTVGEGQTARVWKASYIDANGVRVTRALRVSQNHTQQYLVWNPDLKGGEWNALLRFNSEHVLPTETALAWDEKLNTYVTLSQDSTLEGRTLKLCATMSEYLEGVQSLDERRKANPHFSLHEIQSIAKQILMGLQLIHAFNIIHRDIKPANILFINGQIKICDFGYSTNEQEPKECVGTPLYMAPEVVACCHRQNIQDKKPYTSKVDIYPVFLILFQMATKEKYFQFESIEQIIRVQLDKMKKPQPADNALAGDSRLKAIDLALKNLICRLGRIEPEYRLSAGKALEDYFFQKNFE